MKCTCLDINLLGIIISSCFICICIILSYFDCREPKKAKCNSIPTLQFSNNTNDFHTIIANAISKSKVKINIAASDYSPNIFRNYYKTQLNQAIERGVKVTILIPERSAKEFSNYLGKSKIKLIHTNTSMGFAVIDSIAYVFNEILQNASNCHSLLTTFSDCEIASNDMNSFFEYQVMKINKKLPSIVPIKQHAKTSVIQPIILPNKNASNNVQTLYFFHNPLKLGDPLRISTNNLIMSTMFLNSNESPKQNVSIYSSIIPPYTSNIFSFYQTFTRVLMANTNGVDSIHISYLAPKSENYRKSNWWLNTTAAFENANVNLYDEEYKGPNFIIIGNRAFVFSHSIDDNTVNYNLGFHYSTNSTHIVEHLSSYFNDVCIHHSSPYKVPNKN